MRDLFDEIWGSIKRNKLRTSATGFAVTSGIFLLIVLLGAGNGVIHTMEQGENNLALDVIQVYGGWTNESFEGMDKFRHIQLDERDERATLKNFSENIKHASAVLTVSPRSFSADNKSLQNILIWGCYPTMIQVKNLELLQGRYINPIDIEQKRKVLVMSDINAKQLFKQTEQFVNRQVNVNGILYNIVGIYKGNEQSNQGECYAPFTTIQTVFGRGVNIDRLVLNQQGLNTQSQNIDFSNKLRKVLGKIHRFSPTDSGAIWVSNSAVQSEQMHMGQQVIHNAFWILGILTLLSGVTGVSNIMLISVKERTHEFGIRKAIGAKPRSLISMIICESILITSIFGYIGMFAGVLFCHYMDIVAGGQTMDLGMAKAQYFIDPTVDMSICIEATIVMIIAGAIAGFIPARKASKVKPIEALRAE